MALATLVYENEVSDAEWETRCDLAALYRIFHNMRMTDLVYTPLSARVPDEPNQPIISSCLTLALPNTAFLTSFWQRDPTRPCSSGR